MAGAEQKIIDVKIKGVNDLLKLKKALKALKDEQKKVTQVNKEGEKEWIDKERAIDKATKKSKQYRKELTSITAKEKGATKAIKKSTVAKRNNASAGKKMGTSMLKMAATITAVIGTVRVLSRVFVTAFKTFTDFEFSMAKVRAISGATTQEFMELTESAKELGRTTFFTAKQVAELQVSFSKLGFSADEIMKVQAATLDLAMATGSDLARAAMVAGSAVRGFGLDADQAGRVVDVMAVAFTSSALDIEKWQTSMTKVSAIAAGIGVDIEGVAAVMGTLSDTGIEASIAGTSLRNIFLKMSNPTEALAKRIGFTVNSTEDMIKALKILNKAQLGQLEMQGLVDKRQVIAMQTMINNVDAIEDYTFALDNASGAGREMAAIMEDSTKGAFKRFSSALEGLYLVFSEKIAPMINKITKGMRGWIEVWTKASDKKISDRMKIQVREFNNLFKVIKKASASENTRQMALAELNRKYGEYLSFQVTDIKDTESLKKAQDELNASFKDRIAIQVVREGYAEYLADNEERLFNIYKLQKQISALDNVVETSDGKLFLKINSRNKLMKQGSAEAMRDAQEFWDFVSDLDIDNMGDEGITGFMQQLEGGLVMAQKGLNEFLTIPMEFFKDANKYEEFQTLATTLLKLQQDSAKATEDEVYWAARLKAVKLEMKDFLAPEKKDLPKCPAGQTYDIAKGICVPNVTAVRDFAEEMARFESEARDEASENFIANEERRNFKLLEMKATLAKAEYDLFAVGDKRKAAAYLKYLKAQETVDRASLKRRNDRLDEGLVLEKRRLKELGRTKQHSALEIQRMELKAEKDMLRKKLILFEKYSISWRIIKGKMDKVDEELNDNTYAKDTELANFQVDLAQGVADTTFAIMNNNLERAQTAELESLQKQSTYVQNELDRQLANKEISQAHFNGEKLKNDTAAAEEEMRIEKEYAIKRKKMAKVQIIIDGALAIAKAYAQAGPLGTFVVPMLIANTMFQLATVDSQSFGKGGMIEEFGSGGMVNGKSHAQGGEKFAVGGRVVELEGGEAVINKRSTAMFGSQLSAMNEAGGGTKFADGGLLNNSSFTSARFNSLGTSSASSGKVVVVESDITSSQSKVKAIQSNASF
mgnify:CR=1 FL=1|tara:strand:- start:865 stop:4188 length:3324 start_codon:yes stop_codon:yes gene_type:complete